MAESDLKNLKQTEKKRAWLGLPPSDRIPGLIEMIVGDNGTPKPQSGDEFHISPKAGGGTFIVDKLDVGGTTYTKTQLYNMCKTPKGFFKSPPGIGTVLRQIRSLPSAAAKNRTGRTGNDQLLLIGKKSGRAIELNISLIEKTQKLGGKAGGDPLTSTPGTKEQERVTLELFRILLEKNSYRPKRITASTPLKMLEADFDKICLGTLSGHPDFNLSKIWRGLQAAPGGNPKIPGAKLSNSDGGNADMRSWYYHFLLQFKRIELDTKLKDDVFDVFDYDEFMNFVTALVKAGPPTPGALATKGSIMADLNIEKANRVKDKKWPKYDKISQKDSWNPADIWLVNTEAPKYWPIILEMKRATTIVNLNAALIKAFKANPRVIVGISLKKTVAGHSPKTHESAQMHYDVLNLPVKGGFPPLNDVVMDSLEVNFPWDAKTNEFTVVTNEMKIHEVKIKATSSGQITRSKGNGAAMRMGSGQSGTSNINLEYKPDAGGAQLGKVPKNLLEKTIQQNCTGMANYELPEWKTADDSIPTKIGDQKYTTMKEKVKAVYNFPLFTFKDKKQLINGTKYPFIDEVMVAKKDKTKWKKDKPSHKTVTMAIQMLDWYYDLTQIYKNLKRGPGVSEDDQFNVFIKDTYYLAQKRGEVFGSRFGPFGKIS